jgi:hypothetical protein
LAAEILVALWREWHPDAVEQLQLPIELSAAPPSGGGWQIFSGFPARIVAGQVPEDESDVSSGEVGVYAKRRSSQQTREPGVLDRKTGGAVSKRS